MILISIRIIGLISGRSFWLVDGGSDPQNFMHFWRVKPRSNPLWSCRKGSMLWGRYQKRTKPFSVEKILVGYLCTITAKLHWNSWTVSTPHW